MHFLPCAAILLSVAFLLSAQTSGPGTVGAASMTLKISGFPDGGQIPVEFSQAAPGVAPGEGLGGVAALAVAARQLRAARAVSQAIIEVSPDNKRELINLKAIVWHLGQVLEKTGDLAGALDEQRKGHKLCRALAAEHPAFVDYLRELAVSHTRIGLLLQQTGDLDGALAEFRKDQELCGAPKLRQPVGGF